MHIIIIIHPYICICLYTDLPGRRPFFKVVSGGGRFYGHGRTCKITCTVHIFTYDVYSVCIQCLVHVYEISIYMLFMYTLGLLYHIITMHPSYTSYIHPLYTILHTLPHTYTDSKV